MEDLLTTKQLMDLLQVDRTTIYRMLNDGRLSGMRVGGQWRFPRQVIDKWLGEQKPAPPAESKRSGAGGETTPPIDVQVLPLYCLQPIQEVFAQTSMVGAVTTDLNGKPQTPVSNSCSFCNLMLGSEKGRLRCEASWKRLANRNDPQSRLEMCHAGFTYAGGRVVVNGQLVAMCFVGQFMVDDASSLRAPAHIAKLAHACDVDENDLTHAARDARVLQKGQAERLLNLLQLVADTYSHIGQERLELLTRLKKVAEIAGSPTA
ncbi:MAG: PocR ligand-binding domain-containing protein [Chloroflexi bacterium]|nr:PocR ligand-binding domain-containing protein [Chloroflexota bacterium]